MMAPASDTLQVNIARDGLVSNYFGVVACTIAVFDFVLTFDVEYAFVWKASFSLVKVLYILARGVPLTNVTIVTWQYLTPNISDENCRFVNQSVGWLTLLGILVAEAILMLRTWAVYERSRRVVIFLIVWAVLTWTPMTAILIVFLSSLRYGPIPDSVKNVPGSGCYVVSGNPVSFVCWVLLMISEAAILGLMVNKALRNYWVNMDSAVFKTVFRDGTVVYFYLFALSTANVIVTLTTSPGLGSTLLVLPGGVIHATLTARIVLNLRQLVASGDQLDLSTFSARATSGPLEFSPGAAEEDGGAAEWDSVIEEEEATGDGSEQLSA
ncbi:hypothetical protein PsYK624_121260 [Phanerochaete sordida]|uniref:DUF6533 domain-containing protein n=1 Tax=Phanerochaete sordida TaxID=48140 RepID=A0A9P3LIQ8_9APHY|nr:hypothetical protein PsYK624_121260 [Phanerochaete sordida]